MMEQKGLTPYVDNLPMVKDAFTNLDNMEKFCQKILDSKLAPDHFYPKLPGTNDRDYTKGNTAAVMMVLMQGAQLKMPALTSLQQIVPVNGLLSVKGDGAKSLILSSGKIEPGSWREIEEGSIEDGTFTVTIVAQRSDTKEKMSRSFSVTQAKKAGLWISDELLRGQDGWKWKKSAWYKYPERMIKYRALGFLARDLFPDVMSGVYTTEEAADLPVDNSIVIETEGKEKVVIPDPDFNQDRSRKLTKRAVEMVDKKQEERATTAAFSSSAAPEDAKVIDEPEADSPDLAPGESLEGYSEDELKLMRTEDLIEICEAIPLTKRAMDVVEGRNTNKKLRGIILAYQDGILEGMLTSLEEEKAAEGIIPGREQAEDPSEDDLPFTPKEEPEDKEDDPEPEAEDDPVAVDDSMYGLEIDIPEFSIGKSRRDFSDAAGLYGAMNNLQPPITDKRFVEIASKTDELSGVYADKEEFCMLAPVSDVLILLRLNSTID